MFPVVSRVFRNVTPLFRGLLDSDLFLQKLYAHRRSHPSLERKLDGQTHRGSRSNVLTAIRHHQDYQ